MQPPLGEKGGRLREGFDLILGGDLLKHRVGKERCHGGLPKATETSRPDFIPSWQRPPCGLR
jgi:hypothetical protein